MHGEVGSSLYFSTPNGSFKLAEPSAITHKKAVRTCVLTAFLLHLQRTLQNGGLSISWGQSLRHCCYGLSAKIS